MAQANLPYGFKVKQKIIAFAPSYEIFDEATNNKIFTAKRNFFQFFTVTFRIFNLQGDELILVKSNWLKTQWKILQKGKLIGTIRFPFIRLCGIKFDVELQGNTYTASDILGWSFTAKDLNNQIGFVLDKKIFRIKDTYKITVYPPLEPIFGLAASLAIDLKFYQGQRSASFSFD